MPPRTATDISRLESALARVAEAGRQTRGAFAWLRGIVHATPDAIHIVKPDLLGQWTRTAALNAADGILGSIADANEVMVAK
jgi:hypothetical protein